MTSPFSAKMTLPDPHMEPALSTLLCNTLALCPGHMRAYSSQGICSFDDIANTSMTILHNLSLQTEHINDSFGNRPQFSTGEFFNDLLLLIQWSIYHRRPISEFSPAILENLEEHGTASKLQHHFDQLLHYRNQPPTTNTPTIRDLHPNLFSPSALSSTPTSTNSSTTSNNKSSNEYSSDEDALPTLHRSTTKPSTFYASPPIISTINRITESPSDDEYVNHSLPTATAFEHGFDAEVETTCTDLDNCTIHDNDHKPDNGNYNDTYPIDNQHTYYDDNGYNECDNSGYEDTCGHDDNTYDDACDYNDGGYDDIDPEPPPDW